MTYSLHGHNKGYQFTSWDAAASILTGASGATFAYRHYQLSQLQDHWIFHRVVALIEALPLLGGIVAIIEHTAQSMISTGYSPIPWRKRPVTMKQARGIMTKASWIAHQEHGKKVNRIADLQFKPSAGRPLKLKHNFAEDQGLRPTMEDAHFYSEMNGGAIAGVFDGHGGDRVSSYACAEFKERFPKALQESGGHILQAFETVLHQIHQDVARHPEWNHMGSTAVISYINRNTHEIYTATLGDSEANIYRRGWVSTESLPLSCVRDWLSPSDRGRLEVIYGKKKVASWVKKVKGEAKRIRSHLYTGVNVSRCIGDVNETGTPVAPRVIHKPKITINKLEPGDTVVLACDGLKDFVEEDQIAKIVGRRGKVCDNLVAAALKKMNASSNDNVTVLSIDIF